MPESKKKILKQLLLNHVEHSLAQRPQLKRVQVADGAQDNWAFFDDSMVANFQVTDFYHACEYLRSGFEAAYKEEKAQAYYQKYRTILRDEEEGIEKVIRTFRYLHEKDKTNKTLRITLRYLRNNRHRMNYARAKALHYPIGSGVVEAACKTLVA